LLWLKTILKGIVEGNTIDAEVIRPLLRLVYVASVLELVLVTALTKIFVPSNNAVQPTKMLYVTLK